MRVRHLTEIAGALMLARSRQTLVAATGVTFSVAFFIALLGFMEGLNALLDGLVLNRTAHSRLHNEIRPSRLQPVEMDSLYRDHLHIIRSVKPATARKGIYNGEAILTALQAEPRVRGVSPKTTVQAFYNLGNISLNGIIHGIDPEREAELFQFADYVTEGEYLDLARLSNSIILGRGLAENMLAKPGDLIQVTTIDGKRFPLKVVGLFQSGIAEIDKVQSYVSLSTSQKLLGQPAGYFDEIHIKLHCMDQAPTLAREYARVFGTDAEDIQTANAQFETGSDARTLISFAVGIVLLIVAGFGIYNILNMMIYEKMDTIAILKATGFSGKDVHRIFTGISLSIGLGGALAGALLGLLFSVLIDRIPFTSPALPTVDTYPVDYGIRYYLIAVVFAVATTWFAGWFPARKASRVDPVDIIRGK